MSPIVRGPSINTHIGNVKLGYLVDLGKNIALKLTLSANTVMAGEILILIGLSVNFFLL